MFSLEKLTQSTNTWKEDSGEWIWKNQVAMGARAARKKNAAHKKL